MNDPLERLAARLLTGKVFISCTPSVVQVFGSSDWWHAHPGEPARAAVQDLAAHLRRLAGVDAEPAAPPDRGEPFTTPEHDLGAALRDLLVAAGYRHDRDGGEAVPPSNREAIAIVRDVMGRADRGEPVAYAVMIEGRIVSVWHPCRVVTLSECRVRAERTAARMAGGEAVALYR